MFAQNYNGEFGGWQSLVEFWPLNYSEGLTFTVLLSADTPLVG